MHEAGSQGCVSKFSLLSLTQHPRGFWASVLYRSLHALQCTGMRVDSGTGSTLLQGTQCPTFTHFEDDSVQSSKWVSVGEHCTVVEMQRRFTVTVLTYVAICMSTQNHRKPQVPNTSGQSLQHNLAALLGTIRQQTLQAAHGQGRTATCSYKLAAFHFLSILRKNMDEKWNSFPERACERVATAILCRASIQAIQNVWRNVGQIVANEVSVSTKLEPMVNRCSVLALCICQGQ